MTARATFTAAEIAKAKLAAGEGLRVTLRKGDCELVIEPAGEKRQDLTPYDQWRDKRG